MLAGSLQDELLSIPGIAGALLEGADDHPAGVRVQLAVGADPSEVGREVQRVLASHGMQSQMAAPVSGAGPSASVVNLSEYEAEAAQAAAMAADLEVMDGPPPAVAVPAVALGQTPDGAAAGSEHAAPAVLADVGVTEDASRVEVTVRAVSGVVATRSVPASPHGLDEAAAMAAAELVIPSGAPRLVSVVDGTIDGSPVVTVLFEVEGARRVAGAAVVQGSRAYAVARAAWAALSG